MKERALEEGAAFICEGSNMDDASDYRPGLRAIRELEIRSPLREAGLTKKEIRFLSREMGLPTWDKPSYACLASRFVYGETIDREKLEMVDRAEELLLGLGLKQMRVRIHGRMARIEALPEDIEGLAEEKTRKVIAEGFKKIGFSYVTLDLQGYRTGSMNETLSADQRDQVKFNQVFLLQTALKKSRKALVLVQNQSCRKNKEIVLYARNRFCLFRVILYPLRRRAHISIEEEMFYAV